MTYFCKKCMQDVPPGSHCPYCGARLSKASSRVAWCIEHEPVRDWMSWNAAARLILPFYCLLFLLILAGEAISGGTSAVQMFLVNAWLPFLVLIAMTAAVLFVAFLLQGPDLIDCVVDSKGVHIRTWLTEPTAVKLLLRLKSPSLLNNTDYSSDIPILLINESDLAWKDIARVQLWPEKTLILLYAPVWWMRVCLYCTPFVWSDTISYMRDKVGRKKTLLLPSELTVTKPKAARKPKATVPDEVLEAAVIAQQTQAEAENVPSYSDVPYSSDN